MRASLDSPYGEIASAWRLAADRFELEVRLPANTRSRVRLPWAELTEVTESGRPLDRASSGVQGVEVLEDGLELRVGAGSYAFAYGTGRFPTWVCRRGDGGGG